MTEKEEKVYILKGDPRLEKKYSTKLCSYCGSVNWKKDTITTIMTCGYCGRTKMYSDMMPGEKIDWLSKLMILMGLFCIRAGIFLRWLFSLYIHLRLGV
jgi:hypothetical protein